MQIGFRLPSNTFSKPNMYWEQIVTENYEALNYSLYVVDIGFGNFINSMRNVGGAQAIIANIIFQEELFNL